MKSLIFIPKLFVLLNFDLCPLRQPPPQFPPTVAMVTMRLTSPQLSAGALFNREALWDC